MEYGLLGEHLAHSYSKEIHESTGLYHYELVEVTKPDLQSFIKRKEYCGLNVTVPYKEEVLQYIDCISEDVSAIGAVNTIINSNGILYGYNTDYFGFKALLGYYDIDVSDKKVLILGSGGTSKTVRAVLNDMKAKCITVVSRHSGIDTVTYEQAYNECADYDIIVNTTPVGMYPNTNDCPIELSRFNCLSAVVDVVYNPIKTKLIRCAEENGIAAAGGLYMLVSQALQSAALFTNSVCDVRRINEAFDELLFNKRNIVLIGMPGSGKTVLGEKLAQKFGKEFIDTDRLIEQRMGMTIDRIFNEYGEARFREIENEAITDLKYKTGCVISTGGGFVINKANTDILKSNGYFVYLHRDVDSLILDYDRPLVKNNGDLHRLFDERKQYYDMCADAVVECGDDVSRNLSELEKVCRN